MRGRTFKPWTKSGIDVTFAIYFLLRSFLSRPLSSFILSFIFHPGLFSYFSIPPLVFLPPILLSCYFICFSYHFLPYAFLLVISKVVTHHWMELFTDMKVLQIWGIFFFITHFQKKIWRALKNYSLFLTLHGDKGRTRTEGYWVGVKILKRQVPNCF